MHRNHKEELQNVKNYKYKGYKLRTKQCLSRKRLTNKIFLHTYTQCVRPSEIFRTSCLLYSIAVFRETTHNQRLVPLLPSNRQRKEQLGHCSNLIKCQTEMDPGKPSLPSF